MKKITFLMLIISAAFTIISCSGDSGGDTDKGYVDPGDWSGKIVSANKRYTITGVPACGPGNMCNAILYENRLNKVDYVGIAVNNAHTATPPTFRLKIYWEADSITSVNLPSTEYTIRIDQGMNEFTSTTDNLNITIIDEGDGTYTVSFNSDISLTGGFTINNGNLIRAVKYP